MFVTALCYMFTIFSSNKKCSSIGLNGMTAWEESWLERSERASLLRHTYISFLSVVILPYLGVHGSLI